MYIRQAVAGDLPRLMEIYDLARAFMRSRGNFVQWGGGYPSAGLVADSVAAGCQWVVVDAGFPVIARSGSGEAIQPSCEATRRCSRGGVGSAEVASDERVAATFWFAVAPEPTYSQLYDGVWLTNGSYGVVHRLASDGSVGGVGRFALDWCFERCVAVGAGLRVDTHECNAVMQAILRACGFVRCGVIYLADGSPRDAFERVVGGVE